MSNAWLLIESAGDVETIAAAAPGIAAGATALVAGSEELAGQVAGQVAQVRWIDTSGRPAEQFAGAMADELSASCDGCVLGVATPAVRTAAAAFAVEKKIPVLSNVLDAAEEGGGLVVRQTVYDDFVETDRTPSPAVLLFNPLTRMDPGPAAAGDAAIARIDAAPAPAFETVSTEEVPAAAAETAEYVIGIGFGVKDPETVGQARELASLMGAEVSCTMNIAEETNLLPGTGYIGLSGIKIAPKLYLALGVSGSSQHLAGLRNAKAIAVVNNDPKAKFFNHSDYGIVGDVEEILPELVKALG